MNLRNKQTNQIGEMDGLNLRCRCEVNKGEVEEKDC